MRRILLVVIGSLVAFFGGRAIAHALASDETEIRWIIADMDDSFDRAKMARCLRSVAQDWAHENSPSIDREKLRGALLHALFNERNKEKRFTLRVDVPATNLVIEIDGDEAVVRAVVKFSRLHKQEWEPVWDFELEADFERRDGDWMIVETTHRDVFGKSF